MQRRYNKTLTRAFKKLELIHSNLASLFLIRSISKSVYFIIFINNAIRMTQVYFLRSKAFKKVLQIFQQFKAFVKKDAEASIRCFRYDNGKGEYDNHLFKNFLFANRITFKLSAPYTQNQNGVSKRVVRTIFKKARTMLQHARLSKRFQEEAVCTAVYLKNRSLTKAVDLATPFQAWTGQKPVLQHLQPFRYDMHIFVSPKLRTEQKSKIKSCTFIRYVKNTTKQYHVWNRQRIVVIAFSNIRLDKESYKNRDYKQAPNPTTQDAFIRHFPINQDVLEKRIKDLTFTKRLAFVITKPTLQTDVQFDFLIAAHFKSMGIRRSTYEKRPSFKLRSTFSVRIRTLFKLASYQEAVKHLYSRQQERAIKEELEALDKNKTQDLVNKDTILKFGKRVISCKQVYKLKRNADSSCCFKA